MEDAPDASVGDTSAEPVSMPGPLKRNCHPPARRRRQRRQAGIRLICRDTVAILALRVPGKAKRLHLSENRGGNEEDENPDSKDHLQWPHGLAPWMNVL